MKLSSWRAVSAACLLSCAGIAVAAVPVPADSFAPFWARFRAAALRGDTAALAGLTRFPLPAGFDSDQDHPRAIAPTQFPGYFKTELTCQSADGGSNLDMIRRKAVPNGRFDFHDGHTATVGLFSFANGAGGWRLTGLNYGDPSEYKARLQGRC